MPIIHILNVKQGDCNLIEHYSGHLTVIDVCNAKEPNTLIEAMYKRVAAAFEGVPGDFGQRDYPVNPISYMRERNLTNVFRFILTHPDMDHMDGIKAFFEAFFPLNFWDTENNEAKDFARGAFGQFDEDDWKFYKKLRDEKPDTSPKRLTLYSEAIGKFWNRNDKEEGGGDGIYILAPTTNLVKGANECRNYNDCSYVLLYKTGNHRILFGGDSHDKAWDHTLTKHEKDVKDVQLLIAPHHGRSSDRSYEFLDVVNPALTLFRNADSDHLAYSAFSNRNLPIITNNQAGCILVDAEENPMGVFVTNEAFAKEMNPDTFASTLYHEYYYYGSIERK